MDFKQEREKLTTGFDGKDWWKVTPGQFKVKFLDDGADYQSEFEGEKRDRVRFTIEIAGKEFIWGVTKGQTEGSLFGQLVLVGNNRGGLKGSVIDLLVKGAGKATEYTVVDALALMTPKEEKVI